MKKILNWIINFLTGNDAKVQSIFQDIKNKHGEKVVQALDDAKSFLERKDVAGLIAWTKTTTDDKLYDAAKQSLPDVMVAAATARGLINSTDSYSEAILIAMENIYVVPDGGKGSWYRELSGMMAQILKDGKIDWSDLSIFISGVWAIYNSLKK